ncbi:MAG: hypothetical protein KKA35_01720, partial [Proteobacteria bacterium]|nr:hypothetical protein [Pseudomonadota bacterium]
MSEYQYYEFLAIDRPLTPEEMSELRDLSTRAHITPVSFTNEYNWGSFRGDPDKMMQQYFDAHVYVANWMTAVFMVRVPIETLSKMIVEVMSESYIPDFKATETHWIITWSLDESENYDRFGEDDGRDWMVRLAPVRDELLRGDIRSLYIGWLVAVAREMAEDDDLEPLFLEGLGELTAAQQALAEFLEVDKDLLEGAGLGSPALKAQETSQDKINEWIGRLAQDEVTDILRQLLAGKGQQVEKALKNRFAAWRRGLRGDMTEAPRRTVEELLKNAETAKKIRLEKKELEQKKRESKRRKEREAYLKILSENFPKAWDTVRQHIERGSGLAYDDAC